VRGASADSEHDLPYPTRRLNTPAVHALNRLLRLEYRQLLSTFTVTSTGVDGSTGTLLWGINQVNSDAGPFPDTIDFNIPGTSPFTIQPNAQLPTINNPVIINGYSQSNSSPNALAQGDNAAIQIALNGSFAVANDGLWASTSCRESGSTAAPTPSAERPRAPAT
jgi:hypothetical protein